MACLGDRRQEIQAMYCTFIPIVTVPYIGDGRKLIEQAQPFANQ